MTIEQIVEIPPSRRLFVDVPQEIPAGRAILTFTPASQASVNDDLENAGLIWANNHTKSDEIKEKLQNLQGSLGKNAFGGLDGVAYQHKVREEWND